MMLRDLFAHPLTRGMDLDDPRSTLLRKRIIQEKPFLRKIYEQWYQSLAAALPDRIGPVLEIGSGPGFLKLFIPDLITSEIFLCPDVKIVLDATQLPFRDDSLRGIVMTDVLHHLPKPRRFFAEAARCVCPGGMVAMIEPWVTRWSKLIYRYLHYEPFRPQADAWEFTSNGPLSGANMAIPWMIFERDRNRFEQEFPEWKIQSITPFMPFSYLVSGGVLTRNLVPQIAFPVLRTLEQRMQPLMKGWAMFAEIRLQRTRSHH